MNHTFLNCQQTANSVVDHCQRSVHFGASDFVANHVVKDIMLVILYVQEGDMENVVVYLEGVVEEEVYQN